VNAISSLKKAVTDAFGHTQNPAENTDVLDTLKQEHDEVKQLLSQLQDAETSSQRRSLVKQIKAALLPHTKAEEKVVYDAVIAIKDKEAQQDGYEGYLEHEWANKTLQRLENMESANSPEHKATAKVLKELVEHHIKEEESAVWKDVREHFDDEERARMNTAFLAAKTKVRVT
jgi:hemerythrin superfamily protein